MDDLEKDVKPEGDDTLDSSSETKTGSPSVPYDRFKEVNDEKRQLQERISELEQKQSTGTLTPDQQKELAAKQYLEKLLDERLEAREKASKSAEEAEQRKFEEAVTDVLSGNSQVKRSDFLSFLEKEGDDYSTVASAMKGYLRLQQVSKETAEKTKEEFQRKPSMPTSQGAGGSTFAEPPADDSKKSFWEVAADAMRGSKK